MRFAKIEHMKHPAIIEIKQALKYFERGKQLNPSHFLVQGYILYWIFVILYLSIIKRIIFIFIFV